MFGGATEQEPSPFFWLPAMRQQLVGQIVQKVAGRRIEYL
jgi:hypothetical protein